jgi:hypothetical protein
MVRRYSASVMSVSKNASRCSSSGDAKLSKMVMSSRFGPASDYVLKKVLVTIC